MTAPKTTTSPFKQLRRRITRSPLFTGAIAAVLTLVIRLYVKTLRLEIHYHPDYLHVDRNQVFYGFWHGRQFLLVKALRHCGIAVMTDISWAGDIQARILARFGYLPVRGSSKRGGAQALLEMGRMAAQGHATGFALDGPRGPIYQSKPGIVFLARKLGRPIVPLMTGADKAWIIKGTWCRYMLPKPFSRCYVAFGAPLHLTPEMDDFSSADLDRLMMEFMQQSDSAYCRAD